MAGKPKKRYISEIGVAPKNNKPAMNAAASSAALPRSSQTTPSSKSHKKKKAETPEKSTPSLTQTESGNAEQTQLSPSPSPSSKRKNLSPGVRLVKGRIYDSDKGKSCHQVRENLLVNIFCTLGGSGTGETSKEREENEQEGKSVATVGNFFYCVLLVFYCVIFPSISSPTKKRKNF